MSTYFVTVTFTVNARDADMANIIVTEYLTEAANAVTEVDITAVDVDEVVAYNPEEE